MLPDPKFRDKAVTKFINADHAKMARRPSPSPSSMTPSSHRGSKTRDEPGQGLPQGVENVKPLG
jgi:hypothetical protein